MIRVVIALSSEGVIAQLKAEGHAEAGPKGTDLICSAFTILLRTFVRSVEAHREVAWTVEEDSSDRFLMDVQGVESSAAEQYRGWCEFLLRGFEDLTRDEPSRIRITYGSNSGRLFHGS